MSFNVKLPQPCIHQSPPNAALMQPPPPLPPPGPSPPPQQTCLRMHVSHQLRLQKHSKIDEFSMRRGVPETRLGHRPRHVWVAIHAPNVSQDGLRQSWDTFGASKKVVNLVPIWCQFVSGIACEKGRPWDTFGLQPHPTPPPHPHRGCMWEGRWGGLFGRA